MVQIPEPAEGPGISSFWEASAQMPRQQAPPAPDPQEHRNKAKELENLQRVFDWLDKKGDKRIDAEELAIHLKFLGFKASKADVEDMIWEVDEDCDRCIDWEEFQSMFYRVRHDKTGWEPRRFFTVVEFMMHDKDMSGTIDMDECMEILFRRFGKEQLESKAKEFMSQDEDGDSDITFTEFTNMDLKSRRSMRGVPYPGQ